MSDEELPTPNPDLHSATDADLSDLVIPPTKDNPGFTGAPQDLIGCTVTFKGAKSAAGLVDGFSHVPDRGLVVTVGGKEYLAADIVAVQPRG